MRPDDPAVADAAEGLLGAYVHVPFCARVCPYCDFAVVAGHNHLIDRYVDAVIAEIDRTAASGPIAAVHVGGGTPTQVESDLLARIVQSLRLRFGFTADVEIALEANPEDWTPAVAAGLAAAGFRRVSFGAQSFDPQVLAYLGRAHQPGDIDKAVAVARDAGFTSVSLDLIFGSPNESPASWRDSVVRSLALEPDHISTYSLTVERGTPLGRAVAAGAPAPDPDDQADKYEAAADLIERDGLVRYEVSNYAAVGHPSRYNFIVWSHSDYLAFGVGAHGHLDGRRWRNHRRLDAYLDAVSEQRAPTAGEERLDSWEREKERLFVGLRRTAGARLGAAGAALVASDAGDRLQSAGVIRTEAERLRITRPLLADAVGREVLALAPRDC